MSTAIKRHEVDGLVDFLRASWRMSTAIKRHEVDGLRATAHGNRCRRARKSRQFLESQAKQIADLAEKYLEQKAEAETANRAKSEFLANMIHELRIPLNLIAAMMQQEALWPLGSPIYADSLGSPIYVDSCKDIMQKAELLRDVISDILDMSRLETARIEIQKADFEVDASVSAAVVVEIATIATEREITAVAETLPGD